MCIVVIIVIIWIKYNIVDNGCELEGFLMIL